jgi:hypothetical protein
VASLLLVGATAVAAGCVDLASFAGSWQGSVAADSGGGLLVGLEPGTSAELEISAVDRQTLAALLTTSDGRFLAARLQPVVRAQADVLSEMTFSGAPLRSYLAFVDPTSEPAVGPEEQPGSCTEPRPMLAVVSLYGDRVELRLIRGADEVYALFSMARRN